MKRLLRPGGYLLIAEMYCDGQTETQRTHVELHHWWAAIDSINGIIHRQTYPRQSLLEMVEGLDLENLAIYDLSDLEQDPKHPEIRSQLEPVFERYIERAQGHPALQTRGAELRQRVQEIGFHSATTLIALGKVRNPTQKGS